MPTLEKPRPSGRGDVTLAEFRSWFEGFAAALDGPPNERQWEEIKRKVDGINAPLGLPMPRFGDTPKLPGRHRVLPREEVVFGGPGVLVRSGEQPYRAHPGSDLDATA